MIDDVTKSDSIELGDAVAFARYGLSQVIPFYLYCRNKKMIMQKQLRAYQAYLVEIKSPQRDQVTSINIKKYEL